MDVIPIPFTEFEPPWGLRNGLTMTLYTALQASQRWQKNLREPAPPYQETLFSGAGGVPLFGWIAIPDQARGTIIGTYGITGRLENQWYLQILGRKAYAEGYAVVLFDWRGHGKTAELSPTLTSDGLYEGEDFLHIAAQAQRAGAPAPFWLTGYSLGGQLALWGIKAAEQEGMPLDPTAIAGAAVISPNLDSQRSLTYLLNHPLGKYLEQAIARELQKLVQRLHRAHPGALDPQAIAQVKTIWDFDQQLVIPALGFASVEAYYQASSPLQLLPHLRKPVLILYAMDDPLFDPTLVDDLKLACAPNPAIDLALTRWGGHVGYLSSRTNQTVAGDLDPWWAWNRILQWWKARSPIMA